MSFSRRDFLAGTAAVASGWNGDPAKVEAAESPGGLNFRRFDGGIQITDSSGTLIEVSLEGRTINGISRVEANGYPLRNAGEYIRPEVHTPYGWRIVRFELESVRREDGRIILESRPYFELTHRMEWTEHAMHPLVNTRSWSKAPHTPENSRFDWIFGEAAAQFRGIAYHGFSYSYRYRVPGYPVYQIEDKATWELGGNVAGNSWIMRGGGDPQTHFESTTSYYSGWDLPTAANPHVFQHLPLYTQLQGFTFQYDPKCVLLTMHEYPSHVRSLFQRVGGEPYLLHFNQFCFDSASDYTTPPRHVLTTLRTDLSGSTEVINHYLRVRDEIQARWRSHYGLRYDKARPISHVEADGLCDFAKLPAVFEQLREWEIPRFFLMPIWRSPDSDINPLFARERGRFGVFGNLCCPLEYEIAECYGGWEGFRQAMAEAHKQELECFFWHCTHFSSITPLSDRIPDLFCRDVNGQFNRNNYGHVLWAVNQRSEKYQEYLLNTYRKAKECGLDGVFHDSHFNLSTDTLNFLHRYSYVENVPAPAGFFHPLDSAEGDKVLSMHDTALRLQQQLQQEIGLFYYVESEGSLGTPLTGLEHAKVRGNEPIYSNIDSSLDDRELEASGDDPFATYFKGLSVRLTYQISINPNRFPEEKTRCRWWNAETMVPLNRAFRKAEPYMDEMWVLEDGRGILWKGGDADVLFAYKDFDHELEGAKAIAELVDGKDLSPGELLPAKALRIYLLKK